MRAVLAPHRRLLSLSATLNTMEREGAAVTSSEEESGDDKENLEDSGGMSSGPEYLKYEDFSHTPEGLETYNDGLQHPIEMRRILTGDLSNEMSVSYKDSEEDTYRNLSYPKTGKRPAEVFESPSISVFSSSLLPKPPKLLKGSSALSHSFSNNWLEASQQSMTSAISDNISEFRGHSSFLTTPVSPRKPGRPPTTSGSFDPETGSVRYLCRLQCGASLASAKGRRKHEKKHCPNFGKVEPPILKGQQSQLQKQLALGLANNRQNQMGFSHSLFGSSLASKQNIQINPLKERRVFDCRYCGKVLKTYEGRRLHEKLQHVAKQQGMEANNEAEDTEDNKLLLIEHLKAAGMDPNILDDDPDKILGGEAMIEYNNDEDDDEDDDEEDIEAPSSDGIEQQN